MEAQIAGVTGISWVLVWVGFAVAAAGPLLSGVFPQWNLNLYGDYVGGTVASVWALSGVLFIYSAFLGQKQQLTLQQIELRYSRAEMNATREELIGQKHAMEKLNEINTKQLFESSFFQMISIFHSIVNSIDIRKAEDRSFVTYVGRDCFQVFLADFKSRSARSKTKRTRDEINATYREFYSAYESDLDHYFRYLFHIVKFVHSSKIKNRKVYFGIVAAQLSTFELALLVYNCIADKGYSSFRPLVVRYNLLKDLNYEHLVAKEDLAFLGNRKEPHPTT